MDLICTYLDIKDDLLRSMSVADFYEWIRIDADRQYGNGVIEELIRIERYEMIQIAIEYYEQPSN